MIQCTKLEDEYPGRRAEKSPDGKVRSNAGEKNCRVYLETAIVEVTKDGNVEWFLLMGLVRLAQEKGLKSVLDR